MFEKRYMWGKKISRITLVNPSQYVIAYHPRLKMAKERGLERWRRERKVGAVFLS
jgi:hypothetical protein